ncbi:hypothetical protein BLNAU_2570 [Blattamonas nauphoetae]|uniref:F-box domain-containing protein n=1 Tax=Blattamonas nauphoetae TaxID=2049346 RepID=A0ABQ9YEX3_9EUKA|nr:hypothetical protein BLNAU_2570 [Blattamonas nauphoetae]
MTSVSDFNIAGGLLGLSEDVQLNIIREMSSLHDVQNFLVLSQSSFLLKDNHRFKWAVHTAASSIQGTKFVMAPDLLHSITDITQLSPQALRKSEKPPSFVAEIDPRREPELSMIHSCCVTCRSRLSVKDQILFLWICFYVDGDGRLHKALVPSPTLNTANLMALAQSELDSIIMPNTQKRFRFVCANPSIVVAVTVGTIHNCEVYVLNMTGVGEFSLSSTFTKLTVSLPYICHIRTQNQQEHLDLCPPNRTTLIFVEEPRPSTLPPHITHVEFEQLRFFLFISTGQVISIGMTNVFAEYTALAEYVAIDLTHSDNFSPLFLAPFAGNLDRTKGQWGLFGHYRPISYFPQTYTFLCENGILVKRAVQIVNKTRKSKWVALDPDQYFNGERCVFVTTCGSADLYLFNTGRVMLVRGGNHIDEIHDNLLHPIVVRHPDGVLSFSTGETIYPSGPGFDGDENQMDLGIGTIQSIIIQPNTERFLALHNTGLAVSHALNVPNKHRKTLVSGNLPSGFQFSIRLAAWIDYISEDVETGRPLFFKNTGSSSFQQWFVFN